MVPILARKWGCVRCGSCISGVAAVVAQKMASVAVLAVVAMHIDTEQSDSDAESGAEDDDGPVSNQ
eukprot:1110509-Ditylum_brightwellii.AAC.1